MYSGNHEVNLRRRLDYAGVDEDLADEIVQRGAGADVPAEQGDQWADHWRNRTINDLQGLPPEEQAAALDQAAQEHGLGQPSQPDAGPTPVEVASAAAKGFLNGQCMECAAAVRAALEQQGMPGTVIDLDTHRVDGPGRFISYEGVEDPISTNGRHRAIRVEGDVVFDNHNQNGVPQQEWRERLFSPYRMHVEETDF